MVERGAPECGARFQADESVRWRVWAPRAQKVQLVLLDGERRRQIDMTAEERCFFTCAVQGISEGQRDAYRLNGGQERPDPQSFWQPEGVHRPSAVLQPGRFVWSDHAWQGVERRELIIYEVHVGTFTPEGTFDAIIPRLESLRELGVTAIEIMPVAQFPGTRNWGYDGVHLFAPQNSYGGPHGLQRLVDACHQAGLAVLLDVVYNHLGPEGNYVNEFGPYFADRYHTPWGEAPNFDGAGCDSVREFVLDNVRWWIGDYHMDGLRLDAVHSIYDKGARHILQHIKEAADAATSGRRVHVIAESSLNDVRILQLKEKGGYGLDAQWDDDFHHIVHSHLTGERQGYYVDFSAVEDFSKVFEEAFILDGRYSVFRDRRHGAPAGALSGDRFVVSIQNHDQVGNRAQGDRLSTLISPPAQRLAASMVLLSPYVPLLFMGEEYGERNPFLYFCSFLSPELAQKVREGRRREFAEFAWKGEVPDPQSERTFAASRLTWSWPAGSVHAGLRQMYRDLLTARRQWPPLADFEHRSARLCGGRLQLIRGASSAGRVLRIEFNLMDKRQPLEPARPEETMLFSSEAKQYAGARDDTSSMELLPFECMAFGPADWKRL
jgi:maltooligosyltrehalose trehalohydrolase